MARIVVPVVGGSYKHDTLPFDAQETVNLFPERGGRQSKSTAILRRTPGLSLFATISTQTGPVRGMYTTSGDRFFVVRGTQLYEFNVAGTETIRGTINSGTDRVQMTDNGLELGIADGTNIWSYALSTNTLSEVTDTDAPDTTPSLEFIDGYIFGFDPDASQIGSFAHSDLNDLTTWNSIDVYTAESSPDKIVALKALNGQLWLFGSKGYEVWYNAGGDNVSSATWARVPGTFTQIGCAAANSVAVIRGHIFWLGSSKDGANIVWVSDGYNARRISTRALESTISGYDSIDAAWGFTYEYLGHHFYVLTFQEGNDTFVYDITENEWHNWRYRNPTTGEQGRHRAVNHAYFERKNLVGDYTNGNIYELSQTTYTDNGDPIVWERYFSHFENVKQRISWYMLQLDMLTGSALLDTASYPDGVSVNSLTRSAGTVTVVTASAHGFTTGDEITISGATPDNYNGNHTITVSNSVTFTFITTNPVPAVGAITTAVGDATVTGVNTTFSSDPNIVVGTQINWVDDSSINKFGDVLSITSDTELELTTNASSVATGAAFTYNNLVTATGTITASDQSTQGSDPLVQLRWSDDGGRTYGKWHEMSVGLRGKYDIRVIKRMLGQSRGRVYHVRSSEPIAMSLQDSCVADIEASDD